MILMLPCKHLIDLISSILVPFLLGPIRDVDFVERKPDRALVNDAWLSTFPHSNAEFVPAACSDHCYSLVRLKGADMAHSKPFKYFSFWSKHPLFLEVVRKAWCYDREYLHSVSIRSTQMSKIKKGITRTIST